MASIGLSEAARLTGRNQSTIHRAMKAGRLSYTVDETGERRIDTAELDRVFPIKINGASADALGLSQVLGSGGNRYWRVEIVGRSEYLSEAGTEGAIIDRASDLKQQVGTASRPSHLL